MKWLAGAMQGIFVAFVGAVLLALFQEPIAQHFRSDRLDAWLEMGPWMAHPSEAASDPETEVRGTGFSEVYAKSLIEEDEDPTFGKLTLANKTSQTAHDLRMRFNWPRGPDAYYQGADAKWVLQSNARDLKLPDLAPGDRKIIYLWAPDGFSTYMFESAETYSSAGSFRLTLSRPQSIADPLRETWFDRVMVDWFWWIFGGLGLLFLIGALIMYSVWSEYAKALLKSDDFYLAEQERYARTDVKKKFEPDYSEALKVNAAK